MRISRRALITSIIGIVISIPFIQRLFFTRSINHDPEAVFSALIDTFVPADQFPGALDIRIDVKLMEKIKQTDKYWKAITQLLSILDQLCIDTCDTSFYAASLEQRTKMISVLLTDDSQQALQLQLKSLKNQTFAFFYTAQPAFDMLSYHPPSQGGYPDYDRPL